MRICLNTQTEDPGCGALNRDGAKYCCECGRPIGRFAIDVGDGMVQGRYRIVRGIGCGGFGAVYQAEDTRHPGTTVALKEIFDPDLADSFQNEFDTLKHLRHDHLTSYYDMFKGEESAYLVMEFVPGKSLEQLLHDNPQGMLEKIVLRYAEDLCAVVGYLHQQGIVHRDIKPDNIRLTPEGLLKLVDFGLLKQTSSTYTRKTRRGFTPHYAPPEQSLQGLTSERTDVYSIGATLYHLLTGTLPPDSMTERDPHKDPLRPPHQHNPHISEHVSSAVVKALALRPDERFASIAELAHVLRGQGAPASGPTIRIPPPAKPTPPPQPAWVPELVEIPAGPFLMGSSDKDKQAEKREKPQHRLELPTYWIGKTPVTNAQFCPFVEGDGYHNLDYWTDAGWKWREEEQIVQPAYWQDSKSNGDDYPVVGISWFEAVAYACWLSEQTGHDYYLPTEAEWEKAARGPDGNIWPTGNTWKAEHCNSKEAGLKRTTPVGHYPSGASPYGVLDMAGNVWEWCATRWGKNYPYQLEDEWSAAYLSGENLRTIRGGSWYHGQQKDVRGAYHYYSFPRHRDFIIGVRLTRHSSPRPGAES